MYDQYNQIYSQTQTPCDDTVRKVAAALQKSENRLQTIIATVPMIMFVLDQNGIFMMSEGKSLSKLGLKPGQIVGQSVFEVYPNTPEIWEHFYRALAGEEFNIIMEINNLYFEVWYAPLRDQDDQDGNIKGVMGVANDVTQQKQAEADTLKALAKEKELSELKSRFVSMTSHEFRTPLSIILSSVELLERYSHKLSEEDRREHFWNIKSGVRRMTDMLDDVLLIGKAETGNLEFQPVALDLVEICHEVIRELQFSVNTAQIIDFSSSHPAIWVKADRKLLQQILTNLISNALKYSPTNSTVYVKLENRESQTVIFQVKDQGIGIPAQEQNRLFELFQRGSNVGNIPGTGLGLSIVKRSVELHGGDISVESQEGVGSTFKVTLPLCGLDTLDNKVGNEKNTRN